MNDEKQYYAFISYKREDKKEATRLQHTLEYYKLPNQLRQENPDFPEYVRPIFRDMTDLEVGELSTQIHEALEQSHYLIVICSPRAAKSKWVNDEIEYFISIGKQDKIIPFIIEGLPHSDNPEEECYPPALLAISKEKELLGANINEVGKESAAIRVVSRMFNIRFDSLWQRYQREQRKRKRIIISLGIVFFLFIMGTVWVLWQKNAELRKTNWRMMENQARAVAAKAQELLENGDSYTASLLCLSVIPEDLQKPDRPIVLEASHALRSAIHGNHLILRDHTKAVTSVAFSPDGSKLVSASDDSTIRIWNTATGECLHILRGHNRGVKSANFSPDGKRIVSSAHRDSIRIWDVETGNCISFIPNSLQTYPWISYSPNGRYIIASAYFEQKYNKDSTIENHYHQYTQIWDAETLESKFIFKEAKFFCHTMTDISRDGKYLTEVGESSKKIQIWDIETGKLAISFRPKHIFDTYSGCKSISFSPDGSKLLINALYNDSSLFIIDAKNGEILNEYKGLSSIDFALYSPNNRHIAAKTKEHIIYILDSEKWKTVRIFAGHKDKINSIVFSNDGKKLASASDDNTIRIWEINSTFKTSHKLKGTSRYWLYPNELFLTHDGLSIISSGRLWDEEIYVFDFNTEEFKNSHLVKYPKKTKRIHDDVTSSINLRPNGNEVFSVLFDSILYAWDIKNDSIKYCNLDYANKINSISFSNDGEQVLLGLNDSTIRILDANTMLEIEKICVPPNKVRNAIFSPNNLHILYISADSTIRLLDINSKKELCKKEWQGKHVPTVAYSPNGKYIATSQSNHTIQLWDNKFKKCIWTYTGHTNEINSICFSPDGNRIVSASDDHTLRVWDVNTGECLDIMTAPSGFSHALFRNDNKYIIAKSDQDIILWHLPPIQEVIEQARNRFKDCQLTTDERRRYYLE